MLIYVKNIKKKKNFLRTDRRTTQTIVRNLTKSLKSLKKCLKMGYMGSYTHDL